MNGRETIKETMRRSYLEARCDINRFIDIWSEEYLHSCRNVSTGYVRAGPVRAAGYCKAPSPSIDDPSGAPELQAPGE